MAHLLARAGSDGEVEAVDALRIPTHELRGRNTNIAQTIEIRSAEAQRVIDEHGAGSVPRNQSADALHVDHVHPLTAAEPDTNRTL